LPELQPNMKVTRFFLDRSVYTIRYAKYAGGRFGQYLDNQRNGDSPISHNQQFLYSKSMVKIKHIFRISRGRSPRALSMGVCSQDGLCTGIYRLINESSLTFQYYWLNIGLLKHAVTKPIIATPKARLHRLMV